jgi:hypothetical protein
LPSPSLGLVVLISVAVLYVLDIDAESSALIKRQRADTSRNLSLAN